MELPETASPNPSLILRNRYVLALSLIALLIIASQVMIQLTIIQNDDDSRVINVAGRQRMLSQRISKQALQIVASSDTAERTRLAGELKSAVQLWRASHDALLSGDETIGVHGHNSSRVIDLFHGIEPDFLQLEAAANALAQAALLEKVSKEELSVIAAPILAGEGAFLKGMNDITFQYDLETRQRLEGIRNLEYLLLIITFLALSLEALFIFLPAERQINHFFREMKKAVNLLREQASHDEMTGLYNKATGLLLLGREIERIQRTANPLTVAFLDLDGLKKVNDQLGHEAGDNYIRRFASILRAQVRSVDAAFRFGGDEFVLILSCDMVLARDIVDRLRKVTDQDNQAVSGPALNFSAGLAVAGEESTTTADALIALADRRMYEEKQRHHGA